MGKSKTTHLTRPQEEVIFFDQILSAGQHLLVVQKLPNIVTRALPQTTCHYDNLCDHTGVPKPGTYRFSVERAQNLMSATRPIGFKGVRNLSTVRNSPALMGHGKEGELWICLTCYEGVLDDKLYQKLFGGGKEQAGPPRLIEWVNFIVPEVRSLPEFPGSFTLSSPQRHTVFLWVAVHRWLVYLCEHPKVKNLLDDGVYVEKAFPSDLFPALNYADALYLDAETRDFRGRMLNGQTAELKWDQVFNKPLSSSLAMSDELVEFLGTEASATNSGRPEESEESGFEEDSSSQGDEDGDRGTKDEEDDEEEDENEEDNDEDDDNGDQNEREEDAPPTVQNDDVQAGSMEKVTVNGISTRPPLAAGPSSTISPTPPETVHGAAVRGKKRDHEGQIIGESSTSTATNDDKDNCVNDSQGQDSYSLGSRGVQDVEKESEARRRRRAKLAWEEYLRSPHCS